MTGTSVGIVVPTLGTRPAFLLECLQSIRAAGEAFVLIVAPESADLASIADQGLFDARINDPGVGLAAAINEGLRGLPAEVRYMNWLGDDDKLMPHSLEITERVLSENLNAAYVYGGCNYIDTNGNILWTNRSGKWAKLLMRVGPDLIPQPGALVRRETFEEIGGLDTSLGWAFDLDMFIKMSRIRTGLHVKHVLAEFRWHDGSLSVGARGGSAAESRVVRRQQLPSLLRPISALWEWPFGLAGQLAANRLSRIAKR